MADVEAQPNESFDSLLKRFNKRVQQAGILSEARRRSRYEKPLSRNHRKEIAKRRMATKMARRIK